MVRAEGGDGGLFTEEWTPAHDDEPPCRPFEVYQQRLALLETRARMTWGEDCTYLVLAH